VLFLDDEVVLPGMVVPVELTDAAQASLDAARASRASRPHEPLQLLVVPRVDGHSGALGAVAEVTQVGRLPGGEPVAVLRATRRARIGQGVPGPGAALWVEAEPLTEPAATPRARELAGEVKSVLTSILQERGAWQVLDAVQRLTEPAEIADAAGYASWLDTEAKLELLGTLDPQARLERLLTRARTYLAELEVSRTIRDEVREGMDRTQREFLLRQQLAAIRKELGEGDAGDGADHRSRIEAADLPDAVREAALREADRLERTPDASPENGWIRTWLDTVLDVPWATRTAAT
jgi:ATP-dependent Lon protease